MTLLFLHGWGFDARVWAAMRALLGDFAARFAERGYFGPANGSAAANGEPLAGPVLAVAHSFGAMRLLADPPAACRGLVAINGFDRFAAGPATAGVAPRVLLRMRQRLAEAPEATVADFRARCGCDEPAGAIRGAALADDLAALAQDDRREEAGRFAGPILSLDGGCDPILPPALRDTAFERARDVSRLTIPDAGHLLPLTHPEACAAQVRAMAERLA